ncbi:MAG: hypothetical protein AAGU10_10425 [Methanosarcina mazei]|jgi:hypothetical protein
MGDKLKNELDFNEDVLHVILDESRELRSQQLSYLFQVSEGMWNSLNFLIVIFSIYASIFLFLCDSDNVGYKLDSVTVYPLFFSILFLLAAIFLCVTEIFPTNKFKVPTKNGVYGLVNGDKKDVLVKFIKTYLNLYEDIIVKTEERNSLRKTIIIVTFVSIFEFILFVSTFMFKNQITNLITISIVITFAAIAVAYLFKEIDKKRIESLKENKIKRENEKKERSEVILMLEGWTRCLKRRSDRNTTQNGNKRSAIFFNPTEEERKGVEFAKENEKKETLKLSKEESIECMWVQKGNFDTGRK